MNGLIRFSLGNPRAITVLMLTIVLAGAVVLGLLPYTEPMIPKDILPVYRSPAVQVLTFYGGMSASNVEKDITARMDAGPGRRPGRAFRSRGRSSGPASSGTTTPTTPT
jgi:multidrug efflux pump subunit AcrB